MRANRSSLWSAATALGLLASLACGNRAHADDLNLGGNFNSFDWTLTVGTTTTVGGGSGSISVSYLNGKVLPWVYCIDIPDNVDVPKDYNTTVVTHDGTATFSAGNPWAGIPGTTLVGGSATIAGQVAWILDNYANAANTPALQEAVQAAIWKVIYGSDFTVQDSSVNTAMNNILTALGGNTASVGSVLWLSPDGNGQNGAAGPGVYQALVTAAVPEPSTFAIASLCGAGFVFYGLRRRKAMGA